MDYPFPKTWWIDPRKILGGCYPGCLDRRKSLQMLESLIAFNVRVIINLQQRGETNDAGKPFADYSGPVRSIAARTGDVVELHSFPVTDMTPPTPDQMTQIQAVLRQAVDAGKLAYVHCWGGHGRTGTVGGCWLVAQGFTPAQAIELMQKQRTHDPGCRRQNAPQTPDQRNFIADWAASHAPAPTASTRLRQ